MERAVKNFKAVNERWRKVKVGSDPVVYGPAIQLKVSERTYKGRALRPPPSFPLTSTRGKV
jgi:hypothetical protein